VFNIVQFHIMLI